MEKPSIILILFILGSTEMGCEEAEVVRWCTVSAQEQDKCSDLARAVHSDRAAFTQPHMRLECVQGGSGEECGARVDAGAATLLVLDAGRAAAAARAHSLVPILRTVYEEGVTYEYSVCVGKAGFSWAGAGAGARGRPGACFPGVGSLSGWTLPVHKLMASGRMEVIDCNNPVKSAGSFFGESCAPDALSDAHNPLGENPASLTALCGAGAGAGHRAALRCLRDTSAQLACLRHTTLRRALADTHTREWMAGLGLQLVCADDSRAPLAEWARCNWGRAPADVVVVSSATSPAERVRYQKWLVELVELYGKPRTQAQTRAHTHTHTDAPAFGLFDSRRYNATDLLFQDATVSVTVVGEEQQTVGGVLREGGGGGGGGGEGEAAVAGLRACPVPVARLCVTPGPERAKCERMKTALGAAELSPPLSCVTADSARGCADAVARGEADLTRLEAGDALHAALRHRLVPFVRELYAGGRTDYLAVAVARQDDPDTEIARLQNRKTCHGSIDSAAGWIYPLAYLIANGWIRQYGCVGWAAGSAHFAAACAPGALSAEYVRGSPDNLCRLCAGAGRARCARAPAEPHFGHLGAVRCLVAGGGDVAFARHDAPRAAVDGRRAEPWARNLLSDDLQLLCPDGTRAGLHEYARCNLGAVPGDVLVGRANHRELDAFTDLLLYAQHHYGQRGDDDFSFSMFGSPAPHSDLVFSDAAVSLQPLPRAARSLHHLLFHAHNSSALYEAARLVACAAPDLDALLPPPETPPLALAHARARAHTHTHPRTHTPHVLTLALVCALYC